MRRRRPQDIESKLQFPSHEETPLLSTLRPPKQSRSRRTLERLVAAALDLLEAHGPEGVTVQAVVARAGSSVGSFYARFRGKEDLLDYLGERVWEDASARWKEALERRSWSEMSLAELARGATGLLVELRQSRVRQLRAIDRASGGDAYERFRSALVSDVEALLLSRRTEIGHPKPELAVRVGLRAVLGVIDWGLGAAAADGAGPLDPDDLVRECAALLLAYLGGVAGGGEEGVEFFDVWA
ncbi:MAG TPA: TetR/AcrR family transcriptional regulator [Longimicrobiales bacterium]|nr:TetR/AcrR family transcriptional regulator [Longimicrobiales bacterium]